MSIETFAGQQVYLVSATGPSLNREGDANTLIGETFGTGADWIAIPALRFHDDIWNLSSRQLGLFLQKFVNNHLPVIILGDIGERTLSSKALSDFIRESNKGRQVWFVPDLVQLEARFSSRS